MTIHTDAENEITINKSLDGNAFGSLRAVENKITINNSLVGNAFGLLLAAENKTTINKIIIIIIIYFTTIMA